MGYKVRGRAVGGRQGWAFNEREAAARPPTPLPPKPRTGAEWRRLLRDARAANDGEAVLKLLDERDAARTSRHASKRPDRPAALPAVSASVDRLAKAREEFAAAEEAAVRVMARQWVVPRRKRLSEAARIARVCESFGRHEEAAVLRAFLDAKRDLDDATAGLWKAEAPTTQEVAPPAGLKPAVESRQERLRLEQALEHAAAESARLADECEILLEAYGDPEPRKWKQKGLRALVETLRDQTDFFEALAVERYADARVAWSMAMGALQRAGHREANPPPPAPTPQSASAKHDPMIPGARWRSGWIGDVVIRTEPWHRDVPPWEDAPAAKGVA